MSVDVNDQEKQRVPIGSQSQQLQQMPGPNFELIVTALAAAPMPVDLKMVLNAPLTVANPVIVGLFDALGNRMPAMDVVARAGFQDVIDRAARILGIVSGEAAQLQQMALADGYANPLNALEVGNFPLIWDAVAGDWNRWIQSATQGIPQVEDTGVNTNPARWLHENHWDSGAELVINAAAAVNLGAAVAAGVTRRIREISVRNTALANTVITLSVGGVNRLSFDVPAQSTRTWSSEDGREFLATVQPQIASSAGAGGAESYITASGVEA